jgi:hypothetical protein
MRGLRSTVALAVVLAGLMAYIYFVLLKKPEGDTETKERVFAALEADKIDEITIKSESGDTTTVRKVNGMWQVAAPLTVKGDESQITAIASNLSSLDINRVVDENPGDLKDYGLDSPRVEIEFKASGDKTYGNPHRLFIGAKTPTGGDLFARHDADKRLVLIAGYTDSIFNRSTFDLRDKTLVAVDRDKIDSITASAGGKAIELARKGTDWTLVKPTQANADVTAVDGLLSRVQTTQMKSIVTEQATPADLKKYGFDKPQGSIALGAGGQTVTLMIGGAAGDGDAYARDPSKPLVATVDAALVKDLQKAPEDYRRKEIFAFRGYSTDRLEFTRDGQTTVFEKTKGQDQTPDKWRRVSPNAGEPDAMNMDSLIIKLEGLRADSFAESTAKTGLDKPALRVYAKFEDGKKEERVSFAKSGNDVYASIPGQPGAAKLGAAAFDDVIKALDLVSK